MTNSTNGHILALLHSLDLFTAERLCQAERQNLGRFAIDLIRSEHDVARSHVRAMAIGYDSALPCTIETLRRPDHAFQLVRLRCTISELGEVTQAELPRNNERTLTDLLGSSADEVDGDVVKTLRAKVILGSLAGEDAICTQACTDRQLIEYLQEHQLEAAQWEALVFVVLVGGGDSAKVGPTFSRYAFCLVDAKPLTTALQVLGPTPGELEQAVALFGSDPDLFTTATNLVRSALDLIAEDRLPLLVEAIRLQVLAAASEGGRISTLVIGPPGIGKSKVHDAAELLQPVFKRGSAGKVTDAGMVGDARSSKRRRRPGLLPQAHTGAFSLEEMNQANSGKNKRIVLTLTNVMERGELVDASASRTTYPAQVSVIVDANRQSDVRQNQAKSTGLAQLVNDIGLPTNVLSRFTYIVEIPRDLTAQVQVATQIISAKNKRTAQEETELTLRLRLLRIYLAWTRSQHANVTIPDHIRARMEHDLLTAINLPEVAFLHHPEFGDYLARMATALATLVSAHARLHHRSEANEQDVDAAFPFIYRKALWLRTTILGNDVSEAVVAAEQPARRRLIALRLSSLHQSTITVHQARTTLGLTTTSPVTIAEDLAALYGPPDSTNHFTIVTPIPA